MIDYGVIVSLVWAQFGGVVVAVLAVGASLVVLYVAVAGVEEFLSLITGERAEFSRRYERDLKRVRRGRRVKDSGDDAYEDYVVRRERQGW